MTTNTPLSTIRICGRFTRMAARRWRQLLPVLGSMLGTTLVSIVKPWPMKVLIDNVLGGAALQGWMASAASVLPSADTRDGLLVWVVVASILVFVLGWAMTAWSAYAGVGFGQRLVYDLSSRLFDHLQRLSLRFHARRGTGDLVRRMTSDTHSVSTVVNGALIPVASSVVTLASMFTVMWVLDARLTVIALLAIPLFVLPIRLYARAMSQRSYEKQEAEGVLYDTVESTLTAMPVVKAFAREDDGDARLSRDLDTVLATTIAEAEVQLRYKVLTGLALALGTAAVVWVGSTQALHGELTVGTIIVYLSYLSSLYAPLTDLMYTGTTIQEAMGSARRVFDVLDAPRDIVDAPDASRLPRVNGSVSFHDVVFAYQPDRPVLQGVTLEVRAGTTLAVVGATGAGKTTLVGLVPRFHDPDAGRVCVDGHDVRHVVIETLRQNIAVVPQESFLFPISLAENIAYGRPDATFADIVDAAKAANVHDLIEGLPDGYRTIVGERGSTLSGGERQRVAIARALLKDAPILILDEPTSALDAETEAKLLQALDRLMAGRTTLIIAHRLSTIRSADTIAVLRGGRIAEAGSHRELLAADGIYARLHRLQRGAPLRDRALLDDATADAVAVADQLLDVEIARDPTHNERGTRRGAPRHTRRHGQ